MAEGAASQQPTVQPLLDEDVLAQIEAASNPREALEAFSAAGADINARSAEEEDTPLHLAAREGLIEACRALSAAGADALARNARGRTPRAQPGLPAAVREVLLDAEEASKRRRQERQSRLWDNKMRATQTASACRLGCV